MNSRIVRLFGAVGSDRGNVRCPGSPAGDVDVWLTDRPVPPHIAMRSGLDLAARSKLLAGGVGPKPPGSAVQARSGRPAGA